MDPRYVEGYSGGPPPPDMGKAIVHGRSNKVVLVKAPIWAKGVIRSVIILCLFFVLYIMFQVDVLD